MKLLYYDLLWSGMTYVILTYLAFRLMRRRRSGGKGGDDGDQFSSIPKIDLPPGVVWPNSPEIEVSLEEEALA